MVAIVYGSLYPFEFRDSGSFAADILLSGGDLKQGLKAAAIFWPICCSICRSVLRLRSRLPVRHPDPGHCDGVRARLSLWAIELAQFYDASRVSTCRTST